MGAFRLGSVTETTNKRNMSAPLSDLYQQVQSAHVQCKKEQQGDKCYQLGRLYKRGQEDIEPNAEWAYSYFRYGCEYGSGRACLMMAAYHTSEGRDQDAYEALQRSQVALRRECLESNDTNSCTLFAANALSHEDDHDHQYLDQALQALQKGCGDGDSGCCVQAGSILVSSDHPRTDVAAGLNLLDMACKQGNGDGCVAQAAALEEANPQGQKATAIRSLIARSCELGSPEGCLQYGTELVKQKKYESALQALEKAHTLHQSESFALSAWIHQAQGQHDKARSYFEMACRLGDEDACSQLDL